MKDPDVETVGQPAARLTSGRSRYRLPRSGL